MKWHERRSAGVMVVLREKDFSAWVRQVGQVMGCHF
jgi:hypothetical protein